MDDYQINHTDLSEKVYLLLKKMILNRQFIGGQRLDLNEMSKKMNISRTPLKEAVNRLVLEGLMEVKPRSGTFVSSLKVVDIEQVSEIRLMVEQWSVSHLNLVQAQKLSIVLEDILEKSSKTLHAKQFQYQEFLELDIRFHYEIVSAGENHRMLEHYNSLNSFLHATRIFYFQSFERSNSGHDEHVAIVRALQEFDLKGACDGLEEHITRSKMIMIDYLNSEEI